MSATDMTGQDLVFCAGAAVGLYGLMSGLSTGVSSYGPATKARRSESPVSYWISIAVNGAVGIGCASALIYRLLH